MVVEMKCINCGESSKFSATTAIGLRHFCTEKCWAEYTGAKVKAEGHYGLIQNKVGWWA